MARRDNDLFTAEDQMGKGGLPFEQEGMDDGEMVEEVERRMRKRRRGGRNEGCCDT